MKFLESILSDLIAGIIGAALLYAFVILLRRVGPERGRQWTSKLRRLGWPSLTFVFFTASLVSAIFRGVTGPPLVVLAVLMVLALASVILLRFGPERVRHLGESVRHYVWQILTGIFILSTVTLFFVNIERPSLGERVVFVVDLADEEMIVLRDVLDEFESELGARVLLMNVDSSRHVARLDKMVASSAMKWDLISVDIDTLGILVAKGLVEELSKYREYNKIVPRSLMPSLHPLLKFEDMFYFAPFRPNVKIAFYNEKKFA